MITPLFPNQTSFVSNPLSHGSMQPVSSGADASNIRYFRILKSCGFDLGLFPFSHTKHTPFTLFSFGNSSVSPAGSSKPPSGSKFPSDIMKCPYCGRGPFINMGKHLQSCNLRIPSSPRGKCPWCEKVFDDPSLHQKLSCKKKPKCFRCGVTFPSTQVLETHTRNGCVQLQCPNRGCNEAFDTTRGLSVHVTRCTVPTTTTRSRAENRNSPVQARTRRQSMSPGPQAVAQSRSGSPAPPGAFHSCRRCGDWFGSDAECRSHERRCRS